MTLYMTWYFEGDIFSAIVSGQVAYDLARPMDLYGKWFCQCVATRLARAILRCFPVLILGLLLPKPYALTLPSDGLQFLLFVISSILTLGVVVAFSMFIYISTFYTLSPTGYELSALYLPILWQVQVPLPFFLDGFRQIAELLPLRPCRICRYASIAAIFQEWKRYMG